MSKRKTNEEFKTELDTIFNGEVELLSEYTCNKVKVLVRYKACGHKQLKLPTKLLLGQGCGQCKGKAISKSKTKSTENFKEELRSLNIDVELLGEYKGTKEKIKIRNNKCGHEYLVSPTNLLHGSGCPVCHGFKDTEKFIEIINQKYPNEYQVKGEYINNKTPILVKHKCGFEWSVNPKDLLREPRCPKCIRSKGERFVADFLKEHNIDYVPQFSFDDCKYINVLKFDFKVEVNGQTRLIEFDGSQHFGKGRYHTEDVEIRDNIKNQYCESHNIPLLRIPYWWSRNDRAIRELKKFLDIE